MNEIKNQENHHVGVLLAHPTFWRYWLADTETEVASRMRWFKHLSGAFDDERIQDYVSRCRSPMEAYGFYWRVLEIITSRMEKGQDRTSVAYPKRQWAALTATHHHKLENLLVALHESGLASVTLISVTGELLASYPIGNPQVTQQYRDSKIQVDCPNLLKYRDEYSKKSGQTPDKLRPKIQITDIKTKGELLCNSAAPLWRELVALLGDENRALIGKWTSLHGQEKVAEAYLSVLKHNPVDPKTYLCDLLKRPVRRAAV